MKKLMNYIVVFAAIMGIASCSKYLDEVPQFALTDANAITDLGKAKAAVAGVYATFQNDDWSGSLYIAQASKAGFVKWIQSDFDMVYTQATRPGAAPWTSFYRSLNAANFAINGVAALPAEAITDAERSALVAEGRCLRAWINANIFWNYGHWWAGDEDIYGLLYRDEVIDLKNIMKGRITVGETYAKLYEDLDFAIANLPAYTSPKYMSKEFAKVLKAKLLLYRGGFRNNETELKDALTLVNDVLATHPATFKMETSLDDLYKTKAWDSNENLFVRYLENDGSRTTKGGYYYTYYLSQIAGNAVPQDYVGPGPAGLFNGADWFNADPRWPYVAGPVRAGETWDETYRLTFKKVARLGSYAGKLANPIDEKYAAYYFRYPELYLMKAELLARTGANLATALAPLNEMRSKRTAPVLPPLAPANMDAFMDMLFKEIFLETFIENGSEFFAATRFTSGGRKWIEILKDKALEVNKLCWPIPDAEIVNNTEMKPNPDM